MHFRTSLHASCFFIAAILPAAAFAQLATTPSAQPARINDQLRIEAPRPVVGGGGLITVPDESGNPKALKNSMSFTLKNVSIKNATAISEAELQSEYADKLGKKITLTELNAITASITAKYRNAGYILSRAVLPPQRIKDGNVSISIVEGFVDNVLIEGANADSALLKEYAANIKNAKPLNTETLERYLLLIQDLPGMTARAVLRPSPTVSGASDVVITLSEKKFDGSATVDNRGTRYVGPVQGGVSVNANNMLGIFDRTQLRGSTAANPSELQFFQISHDEQLDTEGTKLTVSYARTRTQPNYRLKSLDVQGIDTLASAVVSHPFIRSRQRNLFGNVSFDVRNTNSDSLNVQQYADRLKVGRIGGAFDFVDRFSAVNRLDATLSKGFGFADDSETGKRSRANGSTTFWKFNAEASRLQNISGPFGVLLSSKGQLASNALLSAEQFGLGGAQFLSAYDPSEVTGDSGIAGRLELQYSKAGEYQYLTGYQFYTYYDVGSIWTRNPAAGVKDITSMASLGGGVRFNIMNPVSGSLEVAKPLTKNVNANSPNHGDDARVFFSLAYRY